MNGIAYASDRQTSDLGYLRTASLMLLAALAFMAGLSTGHWLVGLLVAAASVGCNFVLDEMSLRRHVRQVTARYITWAKDSR